MSRRGADVRSDAATLRALASLLRSGLTLQTALRRLPGDAPTDRRGLAERAARAVTLGMTGPATLELLVRELGQPAADAAPVLAAGAEGGASLPLLLDRIASLLETSGAASESGAGASAGAKLSARMVAALPLFAVPFVPLADAVPRDAVGIAVVAVGLGLGWTGFRWMARLVPQPPAHLDRAALAAAYMTVVARAGGCPRAALAALGARSRAAGLARVARLLDFGFPLHVALGASGDEGLAALGEAVAGSLVAGTGIAEPVERWISDRLLARRIDFEEALRKAPVLMVLPLVSCVLPAFLLITFTPFLRSFWG